MPQINIKKQSCACCYSPDVTAECTLILGSHTIPICRDCLLDLYNKLNETLWPETYAQRTCTPSETSCKVNQTADVVSADLLSVEEVNKLPTWMLANGNWWWLRSPGFGSIFAASVSYDGSVEIDGTGVNDDSGAVRPALTMSNLPPLEIGETVKVFGQIAQYIGNNKVLLCNSIFNNKFDSETNTYETSEVKQKLDEWFERMKSGAE